jgi:hypothetical protein
MTQRFRAIARLLASAAVLATPFLLTPASASAGQLPAVQCSAVTETHYDPGLTNTEQPVEVTFTTDYQSCQVLDGGAITMAQDSYTVFDIVRSCMDLLGSHPVPDYTVTWNTGEVSHVDATFSVTQVQSTLVVVQEGEVFAGPFSGMRYRHEVGYASVDVLTECSSPDGLQGLENGLLTLTILPV